jgi:outer membrane lipoprotein
MEARLIGRSVSAELCKSLLIGLNIFMFVAGCTQPYRTTLPPDLRNQINPALSFSQIKAFPQDHKEQVVLLGGKVLSAKRLPDSTELVILQLPLRSDDEPTTELTHSQGRFIAYQTEFLDPATIPPGTWITILGKLSGSVTQSLDEADYTYPTLIVNHLKIWPTYPYDSDRYRPGYPYWSPYPYGYPFWGPWGRHYGHYPYWYWY